MRAGRMLREQNADVIILAYRAYVPDAYIHHMLSYVPGVPVLFFASQRATSSNSKTATAACYETVASCAQVQLVAGFRKMNIYNEVEAVAGSIHDDEAYHKINRYIEVVTIFKQLKTMTFGMIGNVFRGMFDFEFDKTKVKGALGPEVMNIQVDHLLAQWEKAPMSDPDVQKMLKHAKTAYIVDGVGEEDLNNAARIAVAIRRLVDRFQLDGLVVLCQHFLEAKLKSTPYLGLSELHRQGDCPATSEGDVLGARYDENSQSVNRQHGIFRRMERIRCRAQCMDDARSRFWRSFASESWQSSPHTCCRTMGSSKEPVAAHVLHQRRAVAPWHTSLKIPRAAAWSSPEAKSSTFQRCQSTIRTSS